MQNLTRTLVASFDALAMTAFAYVATGGTFQHAAEDIVLWGSAVAAGVAAVVVAIDASPLIGWIAIGYVLFAALLTGEEPHLLLLALAVALMPVVQRPRRSLAMGVAVAAVAALVTRAAVTALM
ncbi:MAG: hypothetical protein M3O91_03190 [Chloroflexota bacterium]|nr:hypothetical protein [Chloroflexota bacterium]